MKRMILLLFSLAISSTSGFCGDRQIAFERDQAVWIANLDGTGEKKIADGIFPAISPDGTRIAFNTTEKTSDTTYARHIAVVDIGTGKIDVFKDIPSDNSYYPSWTADGKQILFTTRPHEVWDMGEESGRKNFDGPLPALWTFDVQSRKVTRLTPKGLFGWDGVWLDNENVLFLSRDAAEKEDSINRMSTDGKNLK